MYELHEVDLKTFEDKILEVGGVGFIKKHLLEYKILNLKNYYYTIEIYNFRKEDFCEICGKNFKELLEIDPKNDGSWMARQVGRYICNNCVKPLIPQLRMESSKDHREGCCCHSCIIASELGYTKKNNNWIIRPTVRCYSKIEGCENCYHSKEHIQNKYCDYNFMEKGCNRTEGCIEANKI